MPEPNEGECSYRTNPQTICFQNTLVLIAFLLSVAILSFQINPDFATAIGTLALAAVTTVTVLQNRRQAEHIRSQAQDMQQQTEFIRSQAEDMRAQTEHLQTQAASMREELQFMRRPRLSIYEDKGKEDQDSYVVFQNTGEVPFDVTIRLSLSQYKMLDKEKSILNPDVAYGDLPDEVKVSHGSADWSARHYFLQEHGEPVDKQRIDIRSLLKAELRDRGIDYTDGQMFWFRIDAELYPDGRDQKPHEKQFLFKVGFLVERHDQYWGPNVFNLHSFQEAQNQVLDEPL